MSRLRKVVFLDKDGTLVPNVPYNVDPQRIRLMPRSAMGLRRLHRAGFGLVVVSNQPGVALGRFQESQLRIVADRLRELLRNVGAELLDFRWCPHDASAGCDCRKPAPGLIAACAQEHAVDLSESWMVGDILHDVEAGHRAGCRAVLINNGGETEWLAGEYRTPDATASDLNAAARCILAGDQRMAA